MKIALACERTDSFTNPPIWGDERLARSIQKYMARNPAVTETVLLNRHQPCPADVDVCLLFHHTLTQRARKTVLWYQNNNELDYAAASGDYDGILLAARVHADSASAILSGYNWQLEQVFHIDPDEFPLLRKTGNHRITYLGNNIKGKRGELFLDPAMSYGLEIFGGMWSNTKYVNIWRGPLKGLTASGQLYRNSDAVISFHSEEHARWSMPVCRPVEALVSGAVVFADRVGEEVFGDWLTYTDGGADFERVLTEWQAGAYTAANPEQHLKDVRDWAFTNCNVRDQADRIVTFFEATLNT